MDKQTISFLAATALLSLASCKSHYELSSVSRSRILIDNKYDANPDKDAETFLLPYKHQVDSLMSPVVGEVSEYMSARKPESTLSNLLADILLWGGKNYQESPDFAVYNMGGIRAAFAQGDVTYGDVLDVAPFENKICFLTLSGKKVRELFEQIASTGGEGVSHGVNLVISKDHKLLDCKLNGKEIDDNKAYRVATLDYLAQGNDKLEAFKSATNLVSPQTPENNVRFIIMDYFREQKAENKPVSRKIEGRIIIK